MNIIRITRHPNDPNIVLLHTQPGIAEIMGRYEPARWDTGHKAYLLHTEHLDSLTRFAHAVDLYVLDERDLTPGHSRQGELCDICNRTERNCRLAAMNDDHTFTPRPTPRQALGGNQ